MRREKGTNDVPGGAWIAGEIRARRVKQNTWVKHRVKHIGAVLKTGLEVCKFKIGRCFQLTGSKFFSKFSSPFLRPVDSFKTIFASTENVYKTTKYSLAFSGSIY